MAVRKSIKVKNELALKKKELEEQELILQAELEAELKVAENVEKEISRISEENSFFCGVILTREDLLKVFELALQTGENVKIPFKLYFNE